LFVSISHSEIIIRKGWLGRQIRYKVDAWLEWTEEEKNIVRQYYLGKHEAYTAEKWAEFPKFTYSINDLIYDRPHVRIFPTALAARMFEQQFVEEILPKVKTYIFGNAGPRQPTSYEI
jgi:hypothetical protein